MWYLDQYFDSTVVYEKDLPPAVPLASRGSFKAVVLFEAAHPVSRNILVEAGQNYLPLALIPQFHFAFLEGNLVNRKMSQRQLWEHHLLPSMGLEGHATIGDFKDLDLGSTLVSSGALLVAKNYGPHKGTKLVPFNNQALMGKLCR